jgi:two-component system CheB/CheR fusion protein
MPCELAKRVRPQIAVLDIGMPDLSGYDVARRIRTEAWGKDIQARRSGGDQRPDRQGAVALSS